MSPVPASPVPSSRLKAALPTLGILLAALISGLGWIPLHAVARAGIAGLWITLAVVFVACLPLIPALPALLSARGRDRRDLAWIGGLIGVAYAFYTASLTTTDVARAILLFYIAPVWGTLLEVFVLRRPLTPLRVASLALGAAGLATILGIGADFSAGVKLGDVLALLSGILWSIGLLFVFRREGAGVAVQSAALALGALAGAAILALWLEPAPFPHPAAWVDALPALLVAGLLFVLPLWVLSLWAGRRISPARTTLIFMAEVCVGVGSAALWAGQAFGWREAAGTVLVLAAAAVEFRPGVERRRP
ncbi:MAG TPA: DMT family transporter [Alphaproteobacteria bacterium]|nr:DMT family transporter [Alphaproteobacteria bacterium]